MTQCRGTHYQFDSLNLLSVYPSDQSLFEKNEKIQPFIHEPYYTHARRCRKSTPAFKYSWKDFYDIL